MLEKMSKTKERIIKLLSENPILRDDDNKLIATIFLKDAGGSESLKSMSAFDFLMQFSRGKFTSTESIRRMRCKIQEQRPDLRGEMYIKRKNIADEFSKDINNL